MIFNAPAEF